MLSNEPAPSPWQPLSGRGVLRIPRLSARADEVRVGGAVKVCTVNVGTLRGRSRELVDMLARRNIDICCIQEARYRNEGSTVLGDGEQKYKFWYKGNSEGTNGVGVLIKHELAENIIEVSRYSDRLMSIKAVLGDSVWHIFSLYAPQIGRPAAEKQEFWEKTEEEFGRVPVNDGLIVGGDFNAHVGRDISGYEDVLGLYGFGERNPEGENLLDLCKNHSLRVLNSFYKKEREKLITYKSGEAETQIDLLLMRHKPGSRALDCHAIPGEAFLTQHRPVRAKLAISKYQGWKKPLRKRLKTWKLKNADTRLDYENKFAERMNGKDHNWENVQKEILAAAKDVCGMTSGRRGRERETWWWSEEVRNVIGQKKRAFKVWQRTRNNTDKEVYQARKREARRCVWEAKRRMWEQWSENLNTMEGRNKMFRVAAQMRKDRQDIRGTNFIRDENGGIEIKGESVREIWRRYFEELLNVENENRIEEEPCVEGPIEEVSRKEVEDALKCMKNGRASGPSGVTSELLKYAGSSGIDELLLIFNGILSDGRVPEEWMESLTVAIFKGKGDPLECCKHRGLRLLEHSMKVFEKILDRRLRNVTQIMDGQCGFMPGKACADAIFVLRRMQEKYLEKRKKLYHVFVDLEKAFDRVPRKAIEWALRRQKIPERLVKIVMCLYVGSKSRVCAAGGTSELFDINVGVHQGSTLSPLLFVLVLEEVTKEARQGGVKELLYADDLALTGESREEVGRMLTEWKRAMESKGLRINMEKTKMMVSGSSEEVPVQSGRDPCGVCGVGTGVNSILCTQCRKWCHKRCCGLRRITEQAALVFVCPRCTRGPVPRTEAPLAVEDEEVGLVDHFCYLGDMLSCEGGAERAVTVRTAAAWKKWREISSLLTNRHVPLQSRGAIYSACIRSVLLYGSETWSVTKKIADRIQACDRRMLRYMAGVTLADRVASEEVARRCGVKPVLTVVREGRLRWFGHVKRREGEGLLGEVMELEVPGVRPRGRPKKQWKKNVEEDLREMNLTEADGRRDGKERDCWAR